MHKENLTRCWLHILILTFLAFYALFDKYATLAAAEDFIQVPGVIHVHTTFSSGDYSLEQLVDMAKQKGIEVLIPTDHDLVAMEYGIFPLQNILIGYRI